ncbi:MAG: PEP-CTERM sorting domain-containing protein [Snowella sp.]
MTTMPSNKYQSLAMGIATLGVISSSTLLAPSANAFTIGSIGSNSLTVGSTTFSDFSTTTADLNWLDYAITASSAPQGPQLSVATGPVTVGAGSYNITYKVTTTGLPMGGVYVNQNAINASSLKSISLTPGGADIAGFPIISNDSAYLGFIVPPLNEFYVTDVITVNANGSLTSVSNTYEAVPEPLTMLGAMTAAGFGVGFKRKLAKAGKAKAEKA